MQINSRAAKKKKKKRQKKRTGGKPGVRRAVGARMANKSGSLAALRLKLEACWSCPNNACSSFLAGVVTRGHLHGAAAYCCTI